MVGYSGTPLAKKLGFKEGARVYLINPPENYRSLLAPLPENVIFSAQSGEEIDIYHIFARSREELAAAISPLLLEMRQDAAIWVSWPKKASKVPTDLTEDAIRESVLPLGLVDIKVCAVDETWSGLKLVLRKENRN